MDEQFAARERIKTWEHKPEHDDPVRGGQHAKTDDDDVEDPKHNGKVVGHEPGWRQLPDETWVNE